MDTTYRVGLVYINTNNIGDIVIFDTAKYLIEKSLKSKGITNYEIVPIDIGEKVAREAKVPKEFIETQKAHYARANQYVKQWKTSKVYYYFQKNEQPKLEFLDIIIFAGGGLLKYHQQFFYAYIDEITSVADRFNIPVVLNAVGVEKIKSSDSRFQTLRTAINRKCVKAISTRDNLDALKQKYVTRQGIKCLRVCDPALWVKETYATKETKRAKVGLGVIRPEIFELYDVTVPKEELLEFYQNIILGLEKKKINYSLFANGGQRDYEFIKDIQSYMKHGDDFHKNHVEKLPQNGKELTNIINKYDRTLSCRMHAGIIAYALEVPNVSLYWNIKQKYFAELTKQPQNIMYMKQLDEPEKILDQILNNPPVHVDTHYKETDYKYLREELLYYHKRRYFVKGRRFVKAKKRQIFAKIG